MAIQFTTGVDNQSVRWPDAPYLEVSGSLTVSIWARANVASGDTAATGVISKYIGSGNHRAWSLQRGQNLDVLQFATSSTGAAASAFTSATSGGGLEVGRWLHVAGRFEASLRQSIYINGAERADSVQTVSVPSSIYTSGTAPLLIGQTFQEVSASSFDGALAEAAFWNVALSAFEIHALHEGASPQTIRPGNLVFYAPLTHKGDVTDRVHGIVGTRNGTISGVAHPPLPVRVLYPWKSLMLPIGVAPPPRLLRPQFYSRKRVV